MPPDAIDWLVFVAVTVGYFLVREAVALQRSDDERLTLSSWIRTLQRRMGQAGGRTITGVILTTLFVYLMGHLVAWAW